ncbi:MAG: hypothetical protein WBX15_01850 [Thermoanaerobaculia bacterium]
MNRESRRVPVWGLLLLFALVAIGSVVRIYSYDYFWHLATGEWILQHRALPLHDPFSIASERIPWVNGEWLFQVVLFSLYRLVGHAGISIARALFTGFLFAMLFRWSARHTSIPVALLLTIVGWYGADARLGFRPEIVATLFLAMAVHLVTAELPESRRSRTLRIAAWGGLVVLWINIHPSALLAPLLAAAAFVGEGVRGGSKAVVPDESGTGEANPTSSRLARLGWTAGMAVVSAMALLVNPWGAGAILAPLRLAQMVRSGLFVNLEWLPSLPGRFPLLYLTAAIGLALFIGTRSLRPHAPRLLIFLFLSLLAFRFVRNQGYYYAALPLLLAPLISLHLPFREERRLKFHRAILAAAGLIWLMVMMAHLPWRAGVDRERFPVRAVNRLEALDLRGNIYNPDQFGGYLIFRFYPQRRVLVDGRNELFAGFLRFYERARLDSRLWQELLRRYDIRIAVDEYRPPIEVRDAVTGEKRLLPASRVYFPRRKWALIAFDDAAMVFVRRDSAPKQLLDRIEYRVLVPDAEDLDPGADDTRKEAAREIERALREIGETNVLRRLAAAVGGGPSPK